MTPLRQFVSKWENGCGASICTSANRIVLGKGDVPCQVLFVGEAPGESEDVLGEPFVGPAGHLLDGIVKRSLPDEVTKGFCNLVCCIPRNPDQGGKADQPLPEDIQQCSGRLREFVTLCNPRLIVCVGSLSKEWLDPKYKGNVWCPDRSLRKSAALQIRHDGADLPQLHLPHPAWILRQNLAQRGLLIQRCQVQLATAVGEYL